ncbi:MAG: fumarate reductase subunit C [Pseudomonadota bacterium]|nr:fumarate reductase subunit C [Pseudomonadota bacterium]
MNTTPPRGTPQRRVPPLKPVPGYERSMKNWYLHDRPVYRWYMLREMTCVAVGYYALLVIWALARLVAGPEAFDGFIAALRSPPWLAVNLVALAAIVYNAVTWFQVMPKTMPLLFVGGKPVPGRTIVAGGLAALVLASIAVFLAFWMTRP